MILRRHKELSRKRSRTEVREAKLVRLRQWLDQSLASSGLFLLSWTWRQKMLQEDVGQISRSLQYMTGLGAEMWGFAMRHYVSRIQRNIVTQLGGRIPLPPFGTVYVTQRSWKLKKEEFVEKVVAAKLLRPSMDVARGFLVKTDESSYLMTMVAVENVNQVSGEFEVAAPPVHADEPGVRRRLRGKTAIAMAGLEKEERLEKLMHAGGGDRQMGPEHVVGWSDAVDPFSAETLEQWKEGKEFHLLPGKTVHTVRAITGRLKTRAVNFLGQSFSKDQKYAAGADGVLLRVLLRMVALMYWSLCVMDVPKMLLMGGVCKETIWHVKPALYGMVTSPRSREVNGSLWYIMVGSRRAGAIICYVDDLLIAGEVAVAKEAAQMITPDGSVGAAQGLGELRGPELKESECAADFVRTQTMAGEARWLAGRCRPEILHAVRPQEAVNRGSYLLKYLELYPEVGILYTTKPELTQDAQVSSAGVVIEGFCDASFSPNSGRSQQAIMVFDMGGLVAWTSGRHAFVTMSTAESETSYMRAYYLHEVVKAICSDSQAALAVCRCAAGSWRTRLRVLRKRFSCATKTAAPLQIKRLITLFCLTSLVERADGAEIAEGAGRDSLDYMFFGVCMAAGLTPGPVFGAHRAANADEQATYKKKKVELAVALVREWQGASGLTARKTDFAEALANQTQATYNSSTSRMSGERQLPLRFQSRLEAAGGPPTNQFTGERRTIGRLVSAEIRVHRDDFTTLSKHAQLLANKEWKERTELRLKQRR
ncbi:unnamed protein product [Symbiodinium sp. KB8]|nr:unnamed protein product [Symbiodinium sp. KB8]